MERFKNFNIPNAKLSKDELEKRQKFCQEEISRLMGEECPKTTDWVYVVYLKINDDYNNWRNKLEELIARPEQEKRNTVFATYKLWLENYSKSKALPESVKELLEIEEQVKLHVKTKDQNEKTRRRSSRIAAQNVSTLSEQAGSTSASAHQEDQNKKTRRRSSRIAAQNVSTLSEQAGSTSASAHQEVDQSLEHSQGSSSGTSSVQKKRGLPKGEDAKDGAVQRKQKK
ncbi:hypothetical protein GCK72_024386 [Caenorhabditis remanei]|uniref:Uncharacterized protein n=1 Tax=Caenorhabditis remanei TaxID=31234 RepID=A0A6A5FYZ9_CAERE|nr:hypothetical protein GCK72_024386 [Caenorhabditis remanei]KAF1747920.1 hypothetical protein GCK72_024386 [Caenorhabditis remanei]